MLTVITGLPGHGKTLYALQYVDAWAKREKRPVYYHGINGLSPELGWLAVPTKAEPINGEKNPHVDVPTWWECPAKSIILIDEAQNCGFGPRGRAERPAWSALLETHRHLGLDIVFITQDPTLLDPHDRKLCELHFHVMRTFGMQRAVIHEFRPARAEVARSRKGSIEHRWSYPKHVFAWYVSAEAHTHKRRLPARVVIFLALPFVIGALAWFAWSKYLSPNRDAIKVKQAEAGASAPRTGAPGGPGGAAAPGRLSTDDYLRQFRPRISELAYTAPVYDDVTKPVDAPYPAACVSSARLGCHCYTQQGTRLRVSEALCRDIVGGGFFVAWKQEKAPPADAPKPNSPTPDLGAGGYASFGNSPRPTIPAASILDRDPTQPGGRGKALPPPQAASGP